MKLSVFGGTGGTGLQLIKKGVAEGHEITALARRPDVLKEKFPEIRLIRGDVFNLDSVRAAVKGTDAVISALGFVEWSRETKIYSEGVLNVAKAMEEIGPRRLIAVAATEGIDPHPDYPFYGRILMRLVIHPMWGFAYRDMANMTDLIVKSNVDWTLVGVPHLNNGPGKGRYRTSIGTPLHHGFNISRADVASYLLSIINDPTTFRRWTEIAW